MHKWREPIQRLARTRTAAVAAQVLSDVPEIGPPGLMHSEEYLMLADRDISRLHFFSACGPSGELPPCLCSLGSNCEAFLRTAGRPPSLRSLPDLVGDVYERMPEKVTYATPSGNVEFIQHLCRSIK